MLAAQLQTKRPDSDPSYLPQHWEEEEGMEEDKQSSEEEDEGNRTEPKANGEEDMEHENESEEE